MRHSKLKCYILFMRVPVCWTFANWSSIFTFFRDSRLCLILESTKRFLCKIEFFYNSKIWNVWFLHIRNMIFNDFLVIMKVPINCFNSLKWGGAYILFIWRLFNEIMEFVYKFSYLSFACWCKSWLCSFLNLDFFDFKGLTECIYFLRLLKS